MSELIIFKLSDECYGIEVTKVREIQTYESPTPLPNTKPFVKGVINIRGEIVPVIDLHLRFDKDATPEYQATTPVIATRTADNRMIAIVVDSIETIEPFSADKIIELSADAHFINRNFLQGIAIINQEHVVVIDVDRMFSHDEILEY